MIVWVYFFHKLSGVRVIRNTGNSVDITLQKNGSPVAALGSATESDWRSTSVCT